MDLPTYTNIWRIEKRLYKLYDFRLPMPLPVATFGVALGVFVLWAVLLSIVNAPFEFGNGWHLVLWVVPPGVITVLATRPVIEGKRLTELLLSQARFFTEARVYTRLAPEYEPSEVRVSVRVWHRDPACGPLPLRRTDRTQASPREREVEKAEEAPALRPAPEEAPPLWHAPEPEVEPVREPQETHVFSEPEISEPEILVHDLEEERERVPVFAAARSGGHEAVQASTGREETDPAEPRTFTRTSGEGAEHHEARPRRSVGKRVMNYFGFGLDPAGGDGPGTPGQGEGPHGIDDESAEDDFDEPLFATEEDEQRNRDEWFASLRASSGETPVGLTSKGAYTSSDTGPMSSAELAEATRRESTRHRAEEVMAAPAHDTDVPDEESPAARRLRGRVQGIRVARELDERRTEDTRVSGDEDNTERARTTERQRPARRERAAERAPAQPPRTRARGRALPAPAPEGGAEPPPTEPRRESRPHAAPWELDRPGTADGGYPDVSDYAARYAAASGRPATDAPWVPPASATPQEEAPEPRSTREENRESGDRTPGKVWKASGTTPTEPREETIAPVGETEAPATSSGQAAPETEPPVEQTPVQVWKHGSGKDRTVPELDHGTGEHEAMPPRPHEAEEEGRGPEWNERMSVLEQHLIKADTPAPPRPKFADARPATERDNEREDPADWFEDGKKRHPDQPKVGDRGNPVIPARELREERETVADKGPEAGTKPPTQLDHGTGELVSFVEVREDPARADHNTRAEGPAPRVLRRTAADLDRAEAEALERRRAARGEARPSPKKPTAPAGDPRENQSLAGLGRGAETEEEPTSAEERPDEDSTSQDHEYADPHDGMFHRVAQNARRIGQLFGQPVPGEEPEPSAREGRPALELDHGTGEQERLGDTPHGVPSQRSQVPAEPSPATGTRGWRRLAKVVTGGSTPVRSTLSPGDVERLRTPLPGPRNLVVLGCTGGAGQTVTALMIGHTLAEHRDDKVAAVDVNPGPNGLSRRVGAQTSETLTALLANAETVTEYEQMRSYVSRTESGLDVVQTLDDPYVQTLDDRDYGRLTELLGGFYELTLLDPAATGVSRALPVADGLVLVVPASADAERAVSMTFEWLEGNGYGALRASSVLVVNGVSKRSLPDVDAAEGVARGRCRAIVRIPWDDHLGMSYTKIDVNALRPATRRAHGALGGVLVSSLAK